MKRFIFASLTLALIAANVSFAQSSYTDDVYYTGSQAEKDAQQQKEQQKNSSPNANYYNSSGQGNYGENDGNAQIYNDSYDNQDGYIDYDDDSYTTRMRRFYYPMSNIGYWGSVYSPYWMNPYYANPYYNGWYSPGISFSFGFGGGPYWNNYWGMNTWCGYGAFSPYYGYGGYYGFGGGYNSGYWNGYYSGLYDGNNNNRYNNRYSNSVNYGPRGSRSGLRTTGSYGNNSRTSPIDRNGMVNPQRGTVNSNGRLNNNAVRDGNSFQGVRSDRFQQNAERGNLRLNENTNNSRVIDGGRTMQQQAPSQRRGLFKQRSAPAATQPVRSEPVRTAPVRTTPAREYSAPTRSSSPAPSRSYSAPSGGRSSGGSMRR